MASLLMMLSTADSILLNVCDTKTSHFDQISFKFGKFITDVIMQQPLVSGDVVSVNTVNAASSQQHLFLQSCINNKLYCVVSWY